MSYHGRRLTGGELQIGDVLDARYRITGLLGSGGMGSVYRAEHVAIRRPVAIKVLHPDFAGDPDHSRRFQREAFVTGRADHANCVTVSDFGPLEGGGYYLVMELVEGVGLADLLARAERLPARRALRIARHILRGLGHAHAAGVVHRDVKPNNIILVQQGDDPDFAKLLDFGIAKLVEGIAPATSGRAGAGAGAIDQQITRIGTTVGTPTYVAPEQAVGGAVDPRSDLYSLSIVLYEMIAGRPPFRAEETVKLLAMHLSSPVPAMAELVPGLAVSPEVEQLIGEGLAKEPGGRPASADASGAAIDSLFERDVVDPPPPGLTGSAVAIPVVAPAAARAASRASAAWRPLVASRRARAIALAAAGALALVAVILTATRGSGARPEPTRLPSLSPLAPAAQSAPDTTAEDARAELSLARQRSAERRPLEALEAYRRAVALDASLAGDADMKKEAEAALGARDGDVALAAVQLVGDLDGDWARDQLVELASRDRRNAVRQKARALAEKRGAGDRIDRMSSYVLDLLQGKTCEERAEAVPRLRELGDKRAIPALERARKRRSGGFLGFGGRMINGCMRVELDEAIAFLRER